MLSRWNCKNPALRIRLFFRITFRCRLAGLADARTYDHLVFYGND